ncbi:MAG: DUF2807 domain-containing protein [Flavobacteriales bacterium]|nr:DUF2807 domain-containing protein [Flavobacteriales bacterium]
MKKALLFLFTLLILSGIGYSFSFSSKCIKGEGKTVEKEISLDDLSYLSVTSAVDVELSQGPQKVVAVGQANIIELLNRNVKGGHWTIDFTDKICWSTNFSVKVTLPSLEGVNINGSGDVRGNSVFSGESLDVFINGSGDVDLQVDMLQVVTKINGSGDVKLVGEAEKHSVSINGSGDVSSLDMHTMNSSVSIHGSGDVRVHAEKSLKVQVEGSGDVHYKGNPEVSSKIQGSGEIHSIK